MSKTKALLKAVGFFLALNAFGFAFIFIFRWIVLSPFGAWLELNKPTKPPLPTGGLILLEILLFIFVVEHYREKVRGK